MQKSIEVAIIEALSFLENVPLSSETVKNYRRYFNMINKFCQRNDFVRFSDEEFEVFTQFQLDRHKKGEIIFTYFRVLRKAATILADCWSGKELKWKSEIINKKTLSESYELALQKFEEFLVQSLALGTVRFMLGIARQFLFFLEKQGLCDLQSIKLEDVRQFIISVAPRNQNSMPRLVGVVKKFVSFLNDYGCSINVEKLTIFTIPKRRKALPCFAVKEINALLSAIDTSNPIGKRDYAILKIAIGTGLRAVDIRNLKLTDVDWRGNQIFVVQSKTGRSIVLPLLADFGNPLADYILTGRPASDSPYIFLRHLKPHDKLSISIGNAIIQRYQNKAGISRKAYDGKTFHSFRRKMGKRLLKAEMPIATIAQILGHTNIQSVKPYIALNDDMLRACCMDISSYGPLTTRKEALV